MGKVLMNSPTKNLSQYLGQRTVTSPIGSHTLIAYIAPNDSCLFLRHFSTHKQYNIRKKMVTIITLNVVVTEVFQSHLLQISGLDYQYCKFYFIIIYWKYESIHIIRISTSFWIVSASVNTNEYRVNTSPWFVST